MSEMGKEYDTDSFTSNIVAVVIAVIVIAAVAIPIMNGMVGTDGTPEGSTYPIQEGSTLATIVEVIPIFLVLAVLMMVVYMFLQKRGN